RRGVRGGGGLGGAGPRPRPAVGASTARAHGRRLHTTGPAASPPAGGIGRYRPSHQSLIWSSYQGEAGFSLWPPGYTPCPAAVPWPAPATIIPQLGPPCETSPPSAAFTPHESAPQARGPHPSASAPATPPNTPPR